MKTRMYLSECGNYICRAVKGVANYEAWTIDGAFHWVHDGRVRTWEDAAKRRHPLPYCIGGWSCEKIGQKPGSFTLDLLHCDTSEYIKPFSGNVIIESVQVVFRRKIQANHQAAWLRRLSA